MKDKDYILKLEAELEKEIARRREWIRKYECEHERANVLNSKYVRLKKRTDRLQDQLVRANKRAETASENCVTNTMMLAEARDFMKKVGDILNVSRLETGDTILKLLKSQMDGYEMYKKEVLDRRCETYISDLYRSVFGVSARSKDIPVMISEIIQKLETWQKERDNLKAKYEIMISELRDERDQYEKDFEKIRNIVM